MNKTGTDSDTENKLWLLDGRVIGRLSEKGEGVKKYKLVVTK